jgi:hypothetical protein
LSKRNPGGTETLHATKGERPRHGFLECTIKGERPSRRAARSPADNVQGDTVAGDLYMERPFGATAWWKVAVPLDAILVGEKPETGPRKLSSKEYSSA